MGPNKGLRLCPWAEGGKVRKGSKGRKGLAHSGYGPLLGIPLASLKIISVSKVLWGQKIIMVQGGKLCYKFLVSSRNGPFWLKHRLEGKGLAGLFEGL
jgi:hypothetical protein